MTKNPTKNQKPKDNNSNKSLIILSALVFIFYLILETNDQIASVYPFSVLGREQYYFGSGVYSFTLLGLIALGLIAYTIFRIQKTKQPTNNKTNGSFFDFTNLSNDEKIFRKLLIAFAVLFPFCYIVETNDELGAKYPISLLGTNHLQDSTNFVHLGIICFVLFILIVFYYGRTRMTQDKNSIFSLNSAKPKTKAKNVQTNSGGKALDLLLFFIFLPMYLFQLLIVGLSQFGGVESSQELGLNFAGFFCLIGFGGLFKLLTGSRKIGIILFLVSFLSIPIVYLVTIESM